MPIVLAQDRPGIKAGSVFPAVSGKPAMQTISGSYSMLAVDFSGMVSSGPPRSLCRAQSPQDGGDMIKEIRITDLKPGMRVVDTGLSWMDRPFVYSSAGVIQNKSEIQRIVDEGYATVFVELGDPAHSGPTLSRRLGRDAERRGRPIREQLRQVPLKKEIETARQIHARVVEFSRGMLRDVRLGRRVDYEQTAELSGALVDSVMRNEDALLALKYLKSFDEYTFNHSVNVAVVAAVFGKALGLPESRLRRLCQAGVLHDIGKALIPDEILNKPGRLTDQEFTVMREHPAKAHALLLQVRGPDREVLLGVRGHHEKYNGSGYPDGLRGDAVGEFARILAVADVYDALTSQRVYKPSLAPSRALRIMYGIRETDYHPGLVERFIRCLGIYPIGTLVRLTTGETGVVVQGAPLSPLLPTVRVVLDAERRAMPPRDLDLAALADAQGMDAPRIATSLEGDQEDPLLPRLNPRQYLL
jgi:HD-GYP domain-containing protein (c-di-GMP phosphodiesterase class II)